MHRHGFHKPDPAGVGDPLAAIYTGAKAGLRPLHDTVMAQIGNWPERQTSAPHTRLKQQPPGSMCHATTRISSIAEVDTLLKGWLRQAYDAAS